MQKRAGIGKVKGLIEEVCVLFKARFNTREATQSHKPNDSRMHSPTSNYRAPGSAVGARVLRQHGRYIGCRQPAL